MTQKSDLSAQVPNLLSVKKIADSAPHSAFGDLLRFSGRWIAVFREAEEHMWSNGVVRVLASEDGNEWESLGLIEEEGYDLRDPHLSIMPDGHLMLVMAACTIKNKKFTYRGTRVAFSDDGIVWTKSREVLGAFDWLWRVTWHEDVAYGISYRPKDTEKDGRGFELDLYQSRDGMDFELVTPLEIPGDPNESTIRFLEDGRMVALVRRNDRKNPGAWIGESKAPFVEWSWKQVTNLSGGPNFIVMSGDEMWAAGRVLIDKGEDARTVIARMGLDYIEPVITLPSGDDTAYPGLVFHEGCLWILYYSTHEEKTAMYLAKVKI